MNIKVYCRIKPKSKKELQKNQQSCIEVTSPNNIVFVSIKEQKSEHKKSNFNFVFDKIIDDYIP